MSTTQTRALAALIAGFIVSTAPAAWALCQLSKPVHTTECISDEYGMCCITETFFHDATCFDVWCVSFKRCTWELSAEPLCAEAALLTSSSRRRDAAEECTPAPVPQSAGSTRDRVLAALGAGH